MELKYFWLCLISCMGFFNVSVSQIPSNRPEDEKEIGKEIVEGHRPGAGFKLIESKVGSLVFSASASIRYLNQQGLKDSFTNKSGITRSIDKRNDLQFQKLMLYFKGWLFDPKLRYVTYVWTANTSQGQGAQVVLGGNFQYNINKHFDVGLGIGGIPSNRSLTGNWPFWLRQDTRPMAEEFFRASFTTGIWVQGEITKGLHYKTMLGNNLSQLGIDAGQLDDGFDTWGTSIWWVTNNYSTLATYGDFERHDKPATLLGGSFSRSNETRQSQPGTEDPENSQIRISDGTGVFSLNAFGNNTQVTDAKYEMVSVYGGIKYKGFSLDLDYFFRWISKFKSIGTIPVSRLYDHGFNVQASAMVVEKKFQLYSTGSYILGEYGKPWELTFGLNWFPFRNRSYRLNPEIIFVDRSPVGYLSYPTVVGADGTVFMLNLELFF